MEGQTPANNSSSGSGSGGGGGQHRLLENQLRLVIEHQHKVLQYLERIMTTHATTPPPLNSGGGGGSNNNLLKLVAMLLDEETKNPNLMFLSLPFYGISQDGANRMNTTATNHSMAAAAAAGGGGESVLANKVAQLKELRVLQEDAIQSFHLNLTQQLQQQEQQQQVGGGGSKINSSNNTKPAKSFDRVIHSLLDIVNTHTSLLYQCLEYVTGGAAGDSSAADDAPPGKSPRRTAAVGNEPPVMKALLGLEGNVDAVQSGVQEILRDWQHQQELDAAQKNQQEQQEVDEFGNIVATVVHGRGGDSAVVALLEENSGLREQVDYLTDHLTKAKAELAILQHGGGGGGRNTTNNKNGKYDLPSLRGVSSTSTEGDNVLVIQDLREQLDFSDQEVRMQRATVEGLNQALDDARGKILESANREGELQEKLFHAESLSMNHQNTRANEEQTLVLRQLLDQRERQENHDKLMRAENSNKISEGAARAVDEEALLQSKKRDLEQKRVIKELAAQVESLRAGVASAEGEQKNYLQTAEKQKAKNLELSKRMKQLELVNQQLTAQNKKMQEVSRTVESKEGHYQRQVQQAESREHNLKVEINSLQFKVSELNGALNKLMGSSAASASAANTQQQQQQQQQQRGGGRNPPPAAARELPKTPTAQPQQQQHHADPTTETTGTGRSSPLLLGQQQQLPSLPMTPHQQQQQRDGAVVTPRESNSVAMRNAQPPQVQPPNGGTPLHQGSNAAGTALKVLSGAKDLLRSIGVSKSSYVRPNSPTASANNTNAAAPSSGVVGSFPSAQRGRALGGNTTPLQQGFSSVAHHQQHRETEGTASLRDAAGGSGTILPAGGAGGAGVGNSSDSTTGSPRQYTHTGSIESLKRVISDLEDQQEQLEDEAYQIREQSTSVVNKRSIVTSTLLAKRNQLLMKNAPDEEIESLNAQIGAVMHKINEASGRIDSASRSVQQRLESVQRQLKKARVDLLDTNRQYANSHQNFSENSAAGGLLLGSPDSAEIREL